MNTESTQEGAQAPFHHHVRRAIVRAIPAPGHKYRWRCGMRWPENAVEVVIVEEPKPYDHAIGPEEISPEQFEQLRKDRRLAVALSDGSEGGDTEELLEAKADIARLERALKEAHQELAGASERFERFRASSEKQATEAGGRIAKLEHELAQKDSLLAAAAGAKSNKKKPGE